MFVYESVPGTAVYSLKQDGTGMEFEVEGAEDAQITVEMEADTEYSISIDGEDAGKMQTNLGGKLSFSVELGGDAAVAVKVENAKNKKVVIFVRNVGMSLQSGWDNVLDAEHGIHLLKKQFPQRRYLRREAVYRTVCEELNR